HHTKTSVWRRTGVKKAPDFSEVFFMSAPILNQRVALEHQESEVIWQQSLTTFVTFIAYHNAPK
ncbi:MAG: hypothetical protein K5837_04920, partial [Candidatus Saccharibacteria bacterium]|nr:hypothetical protein [Candidatus Saccharibacteria bacterium]